MSKMIGYCGLVCSSCPDFLAPQDDDYEAWKKTAALYSEKLGLNFKPAEISCDGCLSVGGKHIGYCQSCEIRKCAQAKSIDNCAACEEQPCKKLIKFHEFTPDAKISFETLRKMD